MRDVFGDGHGSWGGGGGGAPGVGSGRIGCRVDGAGQQTGEGRDLDVVVRLNGPHVGGVCFA
jgi:hypothetical protein